MIDIKSLLNRDEFQIDFDQASSFFADKIVLIAGAGGSIGSELARQLSSINAKKIILLGRSEESLFFLERELNEKYNLSNVIVRVGSITDQSRIEAIFSEFKPDVVFNSAALKHVPMCENNISETIHNNIFGNKVILDTCLKFKVKYFTLISSDKCVRPASIMGISKRVCEQYTKYISSINSQINISIVRFGNVLGSSGSIVPIVEKQINSGGPITITHPGMTRYFMSISEAAKLVIQSSLFQKPFGLYVLDMGEQVKITDLVQKMIENSGKEINIVYTGIRPGEKLVEELTYEKSSLKKTSHEKILQSTDVACDDDLFDKINDLFYFAKDASPSFLKNKLTKIVY